MSQQNTKNTNYILASAIEQTAEKVRLHDDSTVISSDVTKIAKKLGLEVYEFESPDIAGMIKVEGGNQLFT